MAVQTMTPNGYFVGADGQWIPALYSNTHIVKIKSDVYPIRLDFMKHQRLYSASV